MEYITIAEIQKRIDESKPTSEEFRSQFTDEQWKEINDAFNKAMEKRIKEFIKEAILN